jgi:hypothetical protein
MYVYNNQCRQAAAAVNVLMSEHAGTDVEISAYGCNGASDH